MWPEYPIGRVQCLRLWLLQFTIVADPSQEDWNRLRLYASWMRKVYLYDWFVLEEGTLSKLRLDSPVGGWFPALQKLLWIVGEANLPYANLCFSPHLRRVSIYTTWVEGAGTPGYVPSTIASAISSLPTSTFRSLRMDIGYDVNSTHFADSFSSLVLQCGPSLTRFTCSVPLSDAAINHLIRLPYLRSWSIDDPPPNSFTSPPFLPLSFPPLTQFQLGGNAAHGWVSLFGRLAVGVPGVQGVTPLSKTRESLEPWTL